MHCTVCRVPCTGVDVAGAWRRSDERWTKSGRLRIDVISYLVGHQTCEEEVRAAELPN